MRRIFRFIYLFYFYFILFYFFSVATSVGFTLLIDIVGEWLHRRSRWIEWHMPRNQSQLVSTGLNQSPDRLPRKKRKKKEKEERNVYIYSTFGFTWDSKNKRASRWLISENGFVNKDHTFSFPELDCSLFPDIDQPSLCSFRECQSDGRRYKSLVFHDDLQSCVWLSGSYFLIWSVSWTVCFISCFIFIWLLFIYKYILYVRVPSRLIEYGGQGWISPESHPRLHRRTVSAFN